MRRDLKILNIAIGAFFAAAFSGCARDARPNPEQTPTTYTVIGQPAEPPAGTIQYCWEEPKVMYEQNGPGLDAEGKWYNPSYVAVREAKQGHWVPCKDAGSAHGGS